MKTTDAKRRSGPTPVVCAHADGACANPRSHGTYCWYRRERLFARLAWRFKQSRVGGFLFWSLWYPCVGMLCHGSHPDGRCGWACGFGSGVPQSDVEPWYEYHGPYRPWTTEPELPRAQRTT